MSVIDTAVSRSRTVLLALATVVISGLIAYMTIPKEAEPDIEIPNIYVSISYEGISPEDSERLLVRPMEQELRSIEGIKEMTATAYEGGANVMLEFDAGVDTDKALADVREKVDMAKAEIPSEADEPTVNEVKMSRFDPMLVLNIAGDVSERTLTTIAKDLREKIEGVPGVLEVNLVGAREELMEVIVDPLAMEAYGLDQAQIVQFISLNNQLVAAGSLQSSEGTFPVKVPGIVENPSDVLNMPIKAVGDRVVHFKDIAQVRRTYKDAESYARLNGKPALAIEVVQRSKANLIDTIAAVKNVVAAEQEFWPAEVEIVASRDKSKDVNDMLSELQNSVLIAVLLVFIVIIGILGLRAASLVGIAIPGSFLMGILLIGAFGITINMMVLFALIMAVGMLVDGAIVVTEMADRRMAEGESRKEAYIRAAVRMSWPIIASTCTTLAAFVPLALWPGTSGEFMKYLPLTLIAVLTASLVMALIFVPTLGSIFGRTGATSDEARRNLAAAETGDLDTVTGMTGRYIQYLKRALVSPWRTVGMITGLLLAVYVAFIGLGKGSEWFPSVEQPFGMVDIRARGDLSINEKDYLVRQVEERVLGMDGIEFIYAKTGKSDQGAEDQIGSLTLNYLEWDQRRTADEILADIRTNTADLAGVIIETRKPDPGPPQGKPIYIEFSSRDYSQLGPTVRQVAAAIGEHPGVFNIEDDLPLPGIEWQLRVDRAEAARFGADVTLVGAMVQLVTNGIKLGEYRPDDSDDEIDIRVRYPVDSRSLTQIDELRIPTSDGLVPISTFVKREPAQKVSTINRTDRQRTVTLQADVLPGYLPTEVVAELRSELMPELDIDPAVSWAFRGSTEDQAEDTQFLGRAMAMAIAMMALILVTQFNSLYQAGLILTAVLFSTGGVLLGHLIMGKPFGIIMSSVGVITLAGIVVNNNIVFIDTYNVLRKRGAAAYDAVVRTCAMRLRPVLLTTITTIIGLMPMVLGVNIDLINRNISIGAPSSQWWTQLASSVAGGLAFATILTLFLTPSLLLIQARASEKRAARRAEPGPVDEVEVALG